MAIVHAQKRHLEVKNMNCNGLRSLFLPLFVQAGEEQEDEKIRRPSSIAMSCERLLQAGVPVDGCTDWKVEAAVEAN